jgi:hypothetical protein
MPKLMLDLDALKVSTFATQEASATEFITRTLETYTCTSTFQTKAVAD